jgi:hypothetical protein
VGCLKLLGVLYEAVLSPVVSSKQLLNLQERWKREEARRALTDLRS